MDAAATKKRKTNAQPVRRGHIFVVNYAQCGTIGAPVMMQRAFLSKEAAEAYMWESKLACLADDFNFMPERYDSSDPVVQKIETFRNASEGLEVEEEAVKVILRAASQTQVEKLWSVFAKSTSGAVERFIWIQRIEMTLQ